MFDRTLKKKQRLRALREVLGGNGACRQQECLLITCGDNNGAMNYHLRELGGRWSWADCEDKSIREMSDLLREEVQHVDPSNLPFPSERFDCIVSIDVHEHLEDPETFTREITRLLKPGGRAIITVPTGDSRRLANRLKNRLGMRKEAYGHVRDGFSAPELRSLIRASGIEPRRTATFSRFFTELLELAINLVYVKRLARKGEQPPQEGTIAPATSEQLRTVEKAYRLYSMIYPFVWLVSRLDALLFFTPGYVVIVEGRRPGAPSGTRPHAQRTGTSRAATPSPQVAVS